MLFGLVKLPELFGAVGRGVREFRKNSEIDEGTDKPLDSTDKSTTDPNAPVA